MRSVRVSSTGWFLVQYFYSFLCSSKQPFLRYLFVSWCCECLQSQMLARRTQRRSTASASRSSLTLASATTLSASPPLVPVRISTTWLWCLESAFLVFVRRKIRRKLQMEMGWKAEKRFGIVKAGGAQWEEEKLARLGRTWAPALSTFGAGGLVGWNYLRALPLLLVDEKESDWFFRFTSRRGIRLVMRLQCESVTETRSLGGERESSLFMLAVWYCHSGLFLYHCTGVSVVRCASLNCYSAAKPTWRQAVPWLASRWCKLPKYSKRISHMFEILSKTSVSQS